MTTPPPYLSIVVPCYHTGQSVGALHDRLRAVAQSCGITYEIVLVNDGSSDDTWAHICALLQKAPHVRGIDLTRNFGQQAALLAGLRASRGSRILMIDDDLQDPPELLPQMMRLMDEGADVVYGQRTSREGDGWFRRFLTNSFYKICEFLSEVPLPRQAADFRLINRAALDILLSLPEHPIYLRGAINWIGLRQKALLYERDVRQEGRSNYHFGRLFDLASMGITSISVRPLKVGIVAGIATGVLAMLFLLHIVIGIFYGRPPQGWTSLMAVTLILGSVNLFVLGIIGEYLAGIFVRSQGRPAYLVRESR